MHSRLNGSKDKCMSDFIKYIEIPSNGRCLRGLVHYSQVADSIPIVIVHGYFSANKIGPQRLFVLMAQRLAKSGFDVYRFDLSGMGESDDDICNITFSDHVEDVFNIISAVREKHSNKRVCVIAHCLGSSITLANIVQHPDWFREVIFLAPYYSTQEIMSNFFSEKSLEQLVAKNYTYRKGLYAHSSFFTESNKDEFIENIKNVSTVINVVIPKKDQFIPLESNLKTFKEAKKIIVRLVEGADHNFLETRDDVINLVEELLKDERYE